MMLIFEAMNMPDKNFTYSKQDKQQARLASLEHSCTTPVVQLFAVLSPCTFLDQGFLLGLERKPLPAKPQNDLLRARLVHRPWWGRPSAVEES
jgi:hypothetical protein